MNYDEKLQMFFSCLTKSTLNLYNMAKGIDVLGIMPIKSELTKCQDYIYELAYLKGIELNFELSKIDSQADYSFVEVGIRTKEDLKFEVKKLITHIIGHFNEIIRDSYEMNEPHFAFELGKLSYELFDSAKEFFI